MRAFFAAVTRGLGDRRNDRAFMIDYFEKHTADVIATIPKERLLVYRAGDGWGPLCEFLGAPVPETPFPKVNDRAEFQARAAAH